MEKGAGNGDEGGGEVFQAEGARCTEVGGGQVKRGVGVGDPRVLIHILPMTAGCSCAKGGGALRSPSGIVMRMRKDLLTKREEPWHTPPGSEYTPASFRVV